MHPREFLRRATERFGAMYEDLDRLRAKLRSSGTVWPTWCLLPDQLAAPRLSELGLDRASNALDFELAMTAYAWRRSRDVFRLGHAARRAMIGSRVEGLVGVDVLKSLPESCLYIEAPGLAGAHGFFVRLDYETSRDHQHLWLRFLAFGNDAVMPLALRFGLGQSVDQALHHARVADATAPVPAYAANGSSTVLRDNAHALVSMVLFVGYARDDLRQELEAGDSDVRFWSVGRRLVVHFPEDVGAGAAWTLAYSAEADAAGFSWQAPNAVGLPFKSF